MKKIAIMMATYNGESYIKEQLDSILSQTNQDWMLFIHDDHSSDNTSMILKEYAKKYSEIVLITDSSVVGGSSEKNFSAIHKWVTDHYDFSYFMFADQDDVWYETKIEESLKKLESVPEYKIKPVLVHTDLEIVDEHLNQLGESFFAYRALDASVNDLAHLLVQNNVTGCTMFWNKALNVRLHLDSDNVAMHDWWITLVAASFGRIVVLNKPTIKYRQHARNVVGATKVNTIGFILKRLMGSSHVKQTLALSFKQAEAFYSVYIDQLDTQSKNILERFIAIPNRNKLSRVYQVTRYGYLKQGKVQIIGELLFV
ncbi:glycosyltransferase family 2 protein [Streptococcus sciuri]|uniref:Glycosyltransferase family 2 protein n=1 Tax=Streptococcus sciuri TaxID=2973939 RepID=A0ABT2F5D7_9STRE|nr:glycosyltransferase family 2 protein [Streptococcus sciuri]MCS4487690.1 glycosyltransferase family 2 protein [Streptococcus sciuri]